jgi:DNA-directed RNA polymerase specialized sigma24 family protein
MSASAVEPSSPAIDVGTEWASVRRELLRVLSARQVPHADAEDIVQEVAVRALVHPEGFRTTRDLSRWSWRVAWRLRIDGVRRAAHIDTSPTPDLPGPEDTARLVEGRLVLDAVLSGLTRLSATDRTALFEAPAPDASRQEAVRLAVRRHRARARLTRLVGGLPAAWLWVAAQLRRLRVRTRPQVALTALPVAFLVAVQLGVVVLGLPDRNPHVAGKPGWSSAVLTQEMRGATPARPHAALRAEPLTRAASGPSASTIAVIPIGDALRVKVTAEDRTDPPTACLRNVAILGEICLDRPGPALPVPPLAP